MHKHVLEWIRQADYDLETAEYMFQGGRYFYTIFMCHLCIEKALKGLYQQKEDTIPPKTHDLLFFVEKLELKLPIKLYDFIKELSSASVPTRYPDSLEKIVKKIKKFDAQNSIDHCKEIIQWIREELLKS